MHPAIPRPFDQRTLLARFKTETDSTMSAFVPKPIYSLMGLMSMIGSQEMDLTASPGIDMGTLLQILSEVLELIYSDVPI